MRRECELLLENTSPHSPSPSLPPLNQPTPEETTKNPTTRKNPTTSPDDEKEPDEEPRRGAGAAATPRAYGRVGGREWGDEDTGAWGGIPTTASALIEVWRLAPVAAAASARVSATCDALLVLGLNGAARALDSFSGWLAVPPRSTLRVIGSAVL